MGIKDNFDREIRDAEKQRRGQERKEKWARREKKFWRTFLFTEDGKPKSGLGIYTFSLSFVFLAVYVAAFYLVTEGLTPLMEAWPAKLANLLQSVAAGLIGAAVCWAVHRVSRDKRLALGSFLWLAAYAVLVFVSMLIILRGTGAIPAFLVFFGWFVLIPLVLGLLTAWLLYRRDWQPPQSGQDEPDWKKYTRRR